MPGKLRLPMLLLCAVVAMPAAGRAAVTEDSFAVRTTGDLVDLCAAAPSDPMGNAAVNFCHGFGLGVFRVLQAVDNAKRTKLFCLPDPSPTRNEAVAGFIQWARSNPGQLAQPPQDGIAAYLAQQYPCAGKR